MSFSFSTLGLSDRLVQGVLAAGYEVPTPIQSRAIPIALSGRDVIGCARTGTGKTAAFVLPLLHQLMKESAGRSPRRLRGLVLTPTRELAQQVEDFISGYGRFAAIRSLAVFGGVTMDNQVNRLRHGIDIVIATPGRLLDHLRRRTIDLSRVEVLVIDEADRMFDMGFINDVRTIVARVPATRQTLLFSATMSEDVRALVAAVQRNPEFIQIGEQRLPAESVKQYFYSVTQETKMNLLLHILKNRSLSSALVFSRTKHGADRISRRLERNGVKSIAIHANRTQAQRQRALAGFKQGHYTVLVATDIAARGIDVEGISHVINYDTPAFAEDYIHRIGRTGRADARGEAITFVSSDERKLLKKIEYFVGKQYELRHYAGHEARENGASNADGAGSAGDPQGSRRRASRDNSNNGGSRRAHRGKSGNHSPSGRREPRPMSVQTAATAPARPEEHDWRQVVAAIEEERGGFRKKLSRLFRRP